MEKQERAKERMEQLIHEKFKTMFYSFDVRELINPEESHTKCVFCGDILQHCPMCDPLHYLSMEELIGEINPAFANLPLEVFIELIDKDALAKKPFDLFMNKYAKPLAIEKVKQARPYKASVLCTIREMANKKAPVVTKFGYDSPTAQWATFHTSLNEKVNLMLEERVLTTEERVEVFATRVTNYEGEPDWLENSIKASSKGNSLVLLARNSAFWRLLSDVKLKNIRHEVAKDAEFFTYFFGVDQSECVARGEKRMGPGIEALLEFKSIPKTLEAAIKKSPMLVQVLQPGFAKTWNYKLSGKLTDPTTWDVYRMSVLGAGEWNDNANKFIAYLSEHQWKLPMNKDLCAFLRKRINKTKRESLVIIAREWENDWFPRGASVEGMLSAVQMRQADKLWYDVREKIESYLPEVKGNIFQSTIWENTEAVTVGDMTARMLYPNDHKQVMLGDLTYCCQSLGDAGESSMMEGLVNPDSGFLVFEKKGQIIGQAWVWLSEDKETLVLDNIEFANDREVKVVKDSLAAWCEAAPYPNIQMGMGYNSIKYIGKKLETFKNEAGENVYLNSQGVECHVAWYNQMWVRKYTDAKKRCILKEENVTVIR